MGPNQCDCPQRIMRLLSPLAELPHIGLAADWRVCVAPHRHSRGSLSVGSIVTLPAPTRFSGGITASEFRVAHFRRRTPIFEALDRPGHLCRLRAATLAAATITAPASSEPNPQTLTIPAA